MRSKTRKWFLRRMILGFAVAAIAAPAAQAGVDKGIGVKGTWESGTAATHETDGQASLVSPTEPIASLAEGTIIGRPDPLVRPNTPLVAVSHETDGRASLVRPGATAIVVGRPDPTVRPSTPLVAVSPAADETGFAWSDAGVGAGLAFAAILLLGGATFATRRLSAGRLASS